MKSFGRLRFDSFCCILVCCLHFTLSQRSFEEEPKDAEVNPGQVVVLRCKISNPGTSDECFWLNEGFIKLPSSSGPTKYDYERQSKTGDCSLRITNASLTDGDGKWQCQFPAQQALSHQVTVTVRQAPMTPIIVHQDLQLQKTDNLSVSENKQTTVKCVSRKGNPPANIRWLVDNEDITSFSIQSNTSDTDMKKTWIASSILTYTFQKVQNGRLVKCLAKHAAYDNGSREAVVKLDVHYRPTVKIEGQPKQDIEEGQSLTLSCLADANPSPDVFWLKEHKMYSPNANITFSSVSRSDAGIYHCGAKNSEGNSEEMAVNVNVNFRPQILKLEPSGKMTANLFQTVSMRCDAEGNPLPKYTWLQGIHGKPNAWRHRGSSASLMIHNVTYAFEGTYVCEVSNIINGKEYKVPSQNITLDVRGPPQILSASGDGSNSKLVVEKDEDAAVVVTFCSDPKPQKTYWEWGSVELPSGETLARYMAKPLININDRDDCYEARLIVQHVETSDSRKYMFVAKNEKGSDIIAIPLEVQEPVTVSAVIGIVVSCVIILVVVILIVIYLLRREKCMLLRSRGFKPDSDNGSTGMSEELHNGHAGDQAIPPDALYTDIGDRHNFENLDRNSHKQEDNIVYANLDLQSLEANKAQKKSKPKQETSTTEYAEIQFTPKSPSKADI